MIKGLFHSLVVVFFLCLATVALGAEAGIVLRVTPGAWVERDGERLPLAMRSTVMAGDTLVTDVTGRLQVLFTDDTTISLGADTRVAVTEFIFESQVEKPSFSTEMPKGVARFVTGKIVEQNRDGFKVTTPQATVGIRGTTFSVNVSSEGVTSVIGLDVTRAFPLSITNIATGAMTPIDRSGMGVDATASGNKSYEVPEGHFSQTSAAVNGGGTENAASGGSSGVAGSGGAGGPNKATFAGPATAALNEASEGLNAGMASAASDLPGTGGASVLVGAVYGVEPAVAQDLANSAGMMPMETFQAMISPDIGADILTGTGVGTGAGTGLGAGTGTDLGAGAGTGTGTDLGTGAETNIGIGTGTVPDYSNASGHYAGTLRGPLGIISVGSFSFDASLNAGAGSITNTAMRYITAIASQTGGPAPVSAGAFSVPVVVDRGTLGIPAGSSGDMTGAFGAGNSVSGEWTLHRISGEFHGDKN